MSSERFAIALLLDLEVRCNSSVSAELLQTFGPESVLIWSAVLLKKRIVRAAFGAFVWTSVFDSSLAGLLRPEPNSTSFADSSRATVWCMASTGHFDLEALCAAE